MLVFLSRTVMLNLYLPPVGRFHIRPYDGPTVFCEGIWNRRLRRTKSHIESGMARMQQEPADPLPDDGPSINHDNEPIDYWRYINGRQAE